MGRGAQTALPGGRWIAWKSLDEFSSHIEALVEANHDAGTVQWARRWMEFLSTIKRMERVEGWIFACEYVGQFFDHQRRLGLDFLHLASIEPTVQFATRVAHAQRPSRTESAARPGRQQQQRRSTRTPHANPCSYHGAQSQHSSAECEVLKSQGSGAKAPART